MPNIATVLKAEIARVARKEMRGDSAQLKTASARYRSEIAELKRRMLSMEKQLKSLSKGSTSARLAAAASGASETNEQGASFRWRPEGFKKLRAKLGLSAADMGKLLNCSGQSVYKWEEGKARPRAAQLESIAKVRGMGKKEAISKLAETV